MSVVRRKRRCTPGVAAMLERLEPRQLLSATATASASQLLVTMESAGVVAVRPDPSATDHVQVLKDGVVVEITGPSLIAELTAIVVTGSSGADLIELDQLNALNIPAVTWISVAAGGGDDTVMGSAVADTITGGSGSDLLIGMLGDDRIDGGDGDDLLLGSGGRDTLTGAAGRDRLNGNGSSGDVLLGGDGQDTLFGGTGNDRLLGGGDSDWLFGQAGADRLEGGDDADTIRGGSGKDWIDGGEGSDWLFGQGSAGDTLSGGNGDDLLDGGGGGDFLLGGDGSDSLLGGHGDDVIIAGPGDDILVGGIGDDILTAEAGRDILSGGDGADRIQGGQGEDILIGASTDYDRRHFRWNAIQQTWLSDGHYRTRVNSLLNPGFATPLRSAVTIRDDDFVDTLTGSSGRDWFLGATRECLGPEHLPAEDQFVDRVRTEGRNLTVPYSAESLKAGPGVMDLVPLDVVSQTAVASGNWSDSTVWDTGRIPVSGSAVRIPSGLTVTVDSIFSDRLNTVRVEGHLRFATDRKTQLSVGTVVTLPSSIFEMGTAADAVRGDVSATLLIADNGTFDQGVDPKTIGRGLIAMGQVVMHGAPRTAFAALDGNATTGQTELRFVHGVPADWQAGDEIVVAGTSRNSDDDEVRTILGIQNDGLLVDPIQNWHAIPGTTRPTSEALRIHVANLTRNVVVRSENTDLDRRGHVMFMRHKDVDIRYAGFYDLGRTDKKVLVNDALMDENGQLIPGTGTNQRSRYALHFHRSGVVDDGVPATIHGSVIARSPGWGFVNHSSFVDFTQNVTFDVDGAGFVSEAGDEIGSFRNNIAIRGRGSGLKSVNARHAVQDFAHQGDGFWMQDAGCGGRC
ncbi:MAG: G8 domain-containing protein [Planctomycetaceae bacterium]